MSKVNVPELNRMTAACRKLDFLLFFAVFGDCQYLLNPGSTSYGA